MSDNTPRKVQTMQLSGNAYAKVAERLKLFREDWPKGKSETDHFYKDDGSVEFKAWLWKDKDTLIDLMKGGITDKEVLRSSADSDGDAKGPVGVKQKDFEKLQTIAMGRALANLGYLGSGEIASFEEMEAYQEYKEQQQSDEIQSAIDRINAAKSNEALNAVIQDIGGVLKFQQVIEAGKARREQLTKAAEKPPKQPEQPQRPSGGKKVEKPAEEPSEAPALPLEDDTNADN